MHYRQTIIDQFVATLDAQPTLTGRVTDRNAFPAEVDTSPWVRVFAEREERDTEREVMDSSEQPRALTVQIQVSLAGHDVQRTGNDVLEVVEGAIGGLGQRLGDTADCVYLDSVEWTIAADQDRETFDAVLDYAVWYVTALGDPSTRV